jgi:hypothetical protein
LILTNRKTSGFNGKIDFSKRVSVENYFTADDQKCTMIIFFLCIYHVGATCGRHRFGRRGTEDKIIVGV